MKKNDFEVWGPKLKFSIKLGIKNIFYPKYNFDGN
jgi:hypothetical protein